MSDKYLLPCSCGQTVVVERRQAGTTVNCTCGKSLEVPTIREIEKLAPAPDQQEVLPPIWTLRHGLILLGLFVAIPAFVFATVVYRGIPRLNEEFLTEQVNQLSPAQAWGLWRHYAEGMPKEPSFESRIVIKRVNELMIWLKLAIVVGTVGLLMVVGAFFVPIPKRHQVSRS